MAGSLRTRGSEDLEEREQRQRGTIGEPPTKSHTANSRGVSTTTTAVVQHRLRPPRLRSRGGGGATSTYEASTVVSKHPTWSDPRSTSTYTVRPHLCRCTSTSSSGIELDHSGEYPPSLVNVRRSSSVGIALRCASMSRRAR